MIAEGQERISSRSAVSSSAGETAGVDEENVADSGLHRSMGMSEYDAIGSWEEVEQMIFDVAVHSCPMAESDVEPAGADGPESGEH